MRKILLIMVTVFMATALVACGGKKTEGIEGFKYEDSNTFETEMSERQEKIDFVEVEIDRSIGADPRYAVDKLTAAIPQNTDLTKVKIDGKTLQKHHDKLAQAKGKTPKEIMEDLNELKNITLKFLKLEYNATLMANQDFADELGLVPYDVE